MKKGFVIVLIFLTLLFFRPSFIIATSGCCSSHDGVNCSAGAQANGNVICNDGWTKSTCSYSSMVMCQGTGTSTITSVPPTPINTTYVPLPTNIPVTTAHTLITSTPTLTPKPTNIPTIAPTEVKAQILGADVTVTPTPTSTSSSNSLLGFILVAVLGYFGYRHIKKKGENKASPTSMEN